MGIVAAVLAVGATVCWLVVEHVVDRARTEAAHQLSVSWHREVGIREAHLQRDGEISVQGINVAGMGDCPQALVRIDWSELWSHGRPVPRQVKLVGPRVTLGAPGPQPLPSLDAQAGLQSLQAAGLQRIEVADAAIGGPVQVDGLSGVLDLQANPPQVHVGAASARAQEARLDQPHLDASMENEEVTCKATFTSADRPTWVLVRWNLHTQQGTVQMGGPLALTGQVMLDGARLQMVGVKAEANHVTAAGALTVEGLGTARTTLTSQWHLAAGSLQGPLTANVHPDGTLEVDAAAATTDVGSLSAVFPVLQACRGGRARLVLKGTGRLEHPMWNGRFDVDDGSFHVGDADVGYQHGEGTVHGENGTATLSGLALRGPGLSVQGEAAIGAGGRLDGKAEATVSRDLALRVVPAGPARSLMQRVSLKSLPIHIVLAGTARAPDLQWGLDDSVARDLARTRVLDLMKKHLK